MKRNLRILPGKALIWSDDQGIARLEFVSGAEITGSDARSILELARLTQDENELFNVLIDLRAHPVITDDARQFAASAEINSAVCCFALVADDLAMKLVGNFFIQFHKPGKPTRIFTGVEEARSWLRSSKNKH